MLKWIAVCVSVLLAAAMLVGTTSISVPVKAADYTACRNAAKAEQRSQEACKFAETLWERGLSDPVAYDTLWLALFTWALATTGLIQGAFTYEQIKLARDEFNATNRPNVTIRFIEGPTTDKATGRETVWITFVNKGGSEAEIFELGGGLGLWEDAGWQEEAAPDWKMKSAALICLTVGQPHKHCLIASDDSSFQFGFFESKAQSSATKVAIIGALRYRDKNKIVRETGFHRLYDAAGKCWRPVKNSQYEYAD